ncbi:uncharacterized protein DUF1353 [Kribbella sp. VKM Ac-2569]|uniref:DUF1353 domain-containing protein n=1 Tax=Kribbella sp. VKM Ac-2569 TaxID=2512220 RepID=UPI0010D02373|nr:DUF1353 domain-containing protein [Kribbella sp. VKM Ac-2569]RZT19691.1 uncharacterized protein DUF1353 [Kribbella sp. VKM Ac-2569]
MPIIAEFKRFRDGGDVDAEPQYPPTNPMSVQLERTVETVERKFLWFHWTRKKEQFKLERRIAYHMRAFDGQEELWVVVPADAGTFRTDLVSVPAIFTWLIPRTGIHLPAALVHDGLVYDEHEKQSYLSEGDRAVTRMQADVVLRDAMADLGTSVARRWLIWAAVTLATIWSGAWTKALPAPADDPDAEPQIVPRRVTNMRYRIGAFGSLAIISVVGILATLDWFDKWDHLFWMGDRPWYLESLYGAAGAIVVPLILSVLWFRLWKAGIIVGIALAFLLHVTLAVLLLTLLFQCVEYLFGGRTAAAEGPVSESGAVPLGP